MRRTCIWITCLLVCLMGALGCAAAESTYQSLCEDAGLNSTDVIGWLEIPGIQISMPVMRHPEDGAYYAKHDAAGREAVYGALYVQAQYNAADFSDPVTLVYGSSAGVSAPFGWLQEVFSGSFEQCRTLFIHTPAGTKEYVTFAAVPYASIHILHYYNFRNESRFKSFFQDVYSTRVLGMHLDENNRPVYGKEPVVILSTGLRGDTLQRYLVMAKLVTQ